MLSVEVVFIMTSLCCSFQDHDVVATILHKNLVGYFYHSVVGQEGMVNKFGDFNFIGSWSRSRERSSIKGIAVIFGITLAASVFRLFFPVVTDSGVVG